MALVLLKKGPSKKLNIFAALAGQHCQSSQIGNFETLLENWVVFDQTQCHIQTQRQKLYHIMRSRANCLDIKPPKCSPKVFERNDDHES